ncbi:uncharacterized protein [Onthophagus taurus]|uniref:uncharacterized protein isoform X2 n=1 Tax=Onthophagus taurus TaxID=166361 RepID=UPI000C208A95|nr:uncharacterized protein LOC111415228 isoform X2 [Onthophagus taurus]
MGLKKFVVVLVLFNSFSSNVAYPLQIFDKGCNPTGVLCKSSTTYTFCSTIGNQALYIILNEFSCPEGYFCNENVNFPCILGEQTTQAIITEITTELSEITTDITQLDEITSTDVIVTDTTDTTENEEVTEIVTTEFVTTSSTTKKPFLPPNCIAKGFHPGPNCSQYYECVSEYFWSYKAVLRSCDDGLYFNSNTKTCVEPSISACVD